MSLCCICFRVCHAITNPRNVAREFIDGRYILRCSRTYDHLESLVITSIYFKFSIMTKYQNNFYNINFQFAIPFHNVHNIRYQSQSQLHFSIVSENQLAMDKKNRQSILWSRKTSDRQHYDSEWLIVIPKELFNAILILRCIGPCRKLLSNGEFVSSLFQWIRLRDEKSIKHVWNTIFLQL